MDEVFGFIADSIAKKLREANQTVAEAQRTQAEAQQRAMLRASGLVVPEPPPVPAPSPYARPTAVAAPEYVRNAPRPNVPMGRTTLAPRPAIVQPIAPLDDLFPTALEPLRAAAPKHASAVLLAAFSGGTPLLAAFVLSEALAPPIALRTRER